jgi:hypothetical protein
LVVGRGRALSYSSPQLWNSIPDHIKREETVAGFKKKLKTFLFKKHFS